MSATINVNVRTVVHKSSNGVSMVFPDVCKTPTPSGPVPIPYPNIAQSSDTAMGSTSVAMDGNPIMLKGSVFSTSTGDEAGSVGGVASGVIKGKAEFVNYSFDVMVEGKNVPRLGDMMLHNKGSACNTPPTPEIQPPLPPGMPATEPEPLKEEPPKKIKLKSIYAHQQLTQLAKDVSEAAFIIMLMPIFGDDIPVAAYGKLYRALSDGNLQPPEIEVLRGGIRGHYAAFDSKSRKILVRDFVAEDSPKDEEMRQILFIALLEEYGHFIDWMLRNQYSVVGGDAKDDEGSIYAYRVAVLDVVNQSEIHFADVESDAYSGPIKLDISSSHQAAQKYANKEAQMDDAKYGDYEYFGAGMGDKHNTRSWAHQKIEQRALSEAGFDPVDQWKIYFGNWLRDFSQMVDPAVVRPADDKIVQAQGLYNHFKFARMPALDTVTLSREAITKLLGILAWQEFKNGDVQFGLRVKNLLMGSQGMEILGAYRPEEHIDNPKPQGEPDTWKDARLIDPVFAGPPTLTQLAVNPITGLKNYIATPTPGQSFPTAVQYMTSQLQKAMAAGRNDEGFRYFGGGLHVLEDFFSHSNFVELSFIKLGYSKVVPWVQGNENKLPSGHWPLVTGCFGSTDILASVGPKIANMIPHKMEDYTLIKPGERTPTDQTILIVLEDLKKSQKADSTQKKLSYLGIEAGSLHKWYQDYLSLRDEVNSGKSSEYVKWLFEGKHKTMQLFLYVTNFALYNTGFYASRVVDDLQTLVGPNYGTDPTHSQLAKDDEEHHFHDIAAQLAVEAVTAVGKAMANYWSGIRVVNPAAIAESYIKHPKDCTWMEARMRSWAASNPASMKRAESATAYEHAHHEAAESYDAAMKRYRMEEENWGNRYIKSIQLLNDYFGEKTK